MVSESKVSVCAELLAVCAYICYFLTEMTQGAFQNPMLAQGVAIGTFLCVECISADTPGSEYISIFGIQLQLASNHHCHLVSIGTIW